MHAFSLLEQIFRNLADFHFESVPILLRTFSKKGGIILWNRPNCVQVFQSWRNDFRRPRLFY